MLETIVVVTLITLAIVAPVVALAIHKVKNEYEDLEHPERINLKGE